MDKAVLDLVKEIEVVNLQGPQEARVRHLAYDSRAVKEGTFFFALEGIHTDGHRFIENAIEAGAAAIVHSKDLDYYNPKILYVKVPNSRKALSPISSAFYDHPSRKLKVIGVTGTDGKSSTVSLIHQLLEKRGYKAGLISTVQFQVGEVMEKNALRQSTPEASEIHSFLAQMVQNGKTHAVVESTSHGLAESNNRLGDVDFDTAVLTNVTQEHLEFHGSIEQYRADKSRLFMFLDKSTNKKAMGVVNRDDPHWTLFADATEKPVYTYSLTDPTADYFVSDIKEDSRGSDFILHNQGNSWPVRINLPQAFNIENFLATLGAVAGITGEDPQKLCQLAPDLSSVKGRMSPVDAGQPFDVIVDYAHTPGSFERVLPQVKNNIKGRLIAVFGSAGERDTEKRPIQGKLASRNAEIIVLTDEDPRLEDSMTILKDIQAGCENMIEGNNLFLIPNRKEALRKAFSLAREKDMVLLLGKGHESSIIYAEGPRPWDEETVALEVLSEMGYS